MTAQAVMNEAGNALIKRNYKKGRLAITQGLQAGFFFFALISCPPPPPPSPSASFKYAN